jgi:hypothetical protein
MILDISLDRKQQVSFIIFEQKNNSLHFGRIVFGDGEEMKENQDDFGMRHDH